MKQQTLLITSLHLLFCFTHLPAQQQIESPPSSFALAVNHDNVFGFYPSVNGSYGLRKNLSFTYYSILWTNPSFGNLQAGTDNWLETGVGLGFSAGKEKWYFNPFLGFTHGKLLSGGTRGVIGDGIVPGIFSLFNNGKIEMEIFACWYSALRKEGPATYNYALFWLLPGVQVTERISLGLHYEGFILTGGFGQTPKTQYHVGGAYVKLLVADRYSLRFSLGRNFKEGNYSVEFYKLNLILPLI